MNHILMPSLGHIALVKTAIILWNQDNIKARIQNCLSLLPRKKNGKLMSKPKIIRETNNESEGSFEDFPELEEIVFQKVTQLNVPECLKEELFKVVKPIGLEAFNWIKFLDLHIESKACVLVCNPCWTVLGKVDKKKSAEVLIKDESVHIADRYILACNYCLEDDARKLWNSMPESMKVHFYSEEISYESDWIVLFWTYYLKGELVKFTDKISDFMSREISPYEFGYISASYEGNKTATEYFFKKLNPVEREEFLIYYVISEMDFSDILRFLLSQMNEDEQATYFRTHLDKGVLDWLVEWPLRRFLKETFVTVCKLDLLSERAFHSLILTIMGEISEGVAYRVYSFQELLEQIWLLSPKILKEYVIKAWAEPGDGLWLLEIFNEATVTIILKDATIQEREKIIFANKCCIMELMLKCKWHIIRLFIQECISSTEMMMKYKNEFIPEFKEWFKDWYQESQLEFEEYALNQFNQLMDEVINKKRRLEEGACSRAKKPRVP